MIQAFKSFIIIELDECAGPPIWLKVIVRHASNLHWIIIVFSVPGGGYIKGQMAENWLDFSLWNVCSLIKEYLKMTEAECSQRKSN